METEQVKQHAITDVYTIDEWWEEVKDTPRMKSALRALLQAKLMAMDMDATSGAINHEDSDSA